MDQTEEVCDNSELSNVPQSQSKEESDTEHDLQLEDDDPDFMGENFLDNFAVVDACYSDDDNVQDSSPKASKKSDSLDIEESKNAAKERSSKSEHEKVENSNSRSRSLKGQETDHVFDKNENVHTRSKPSDRVSRKRPSSKDRPSDSLRERDEDRYRKSSERHRESNSSSRRPHHNAVRTRSKERDEKRKPSSRERDSEHTSSRYSYERSSDKRHDRDTYRRETGSSKDKSESSKLKVESKTGLKIVHEAKPVPTKTLSIADDLVPPGTEDVQLPQPNVVVKVEELNSEAAVPKAERSQRTRSQESSEYRKRKRSPEVMTRDRVQEDQDRMSRELSLERLRARSRDKSRERRETSSRLKRELESVRRRNERINEELERNREKLLRQKILREEASLRRKKEALASSRRRSISSERFTSRSGRRYSGSRDHSSRHLELSPISGGRMSRHSDEFVMSPISSYEQSRFDHRLERRRSFSPISSASSMISLSDEEGKGPRRKRKRSPFWKEMERKLGIKMLSGRSAEVDPMEMQRYPLMQVDETAPPPGTFPMSYPPPGLGQQFPPMMNYEPNLYFPPVEPVPPPIVQPVEVLRPNLRVINAKKKVKYVFKLLAPVPVANAEPPEAPPPPQISSGSDSKMSLSSFLEASLKGTDATKPSAEHPVNQSSAEATLARCDAAISALRVDNVLNVITAGRFTVRQNAPRPRALYTSLKRFNHPAQESMVKLKSPLLRTTLVQLSYTTPPIKKTVKPVPAKPANVSNQAATANNSAAKPGNVTAAKAGNVTAAKPGNANAVNSGNATAAKPGNVTVVSSGNVTATSSSRNQAQLRSANIQLTNLPYEIWRRPPESSNTNTSTPVAKETDGNASDSDIMFIAEVPKTVNVIATLDLDPVEEEGKAPAETERPLEATSDISEEELMSDISLSDSETKCVTCSKVINVKMVNASTQCKQFRRTVETQVDFVNNELLGGAKVLGRRAMKRNASAQAQTMAPKGMQDVDERINPLHQQMQSSQQPSNQTMTLQSTPKPSLPNPIQFQKSSENLKTTSTSFQGFSISNNMSKKAPGLPLSTAGLSLNSPINVGTKQPGLGGAFFKESFQSVSGKSIFGGSSETSQPMNLPVSQPPVQKSILKPHQPMLSASRTMFGGSLFKPSDPPVQPVVQPPPNNIPFKITPQNFTNQKTSFPTANVSYPNQQTNKQAAYPNLQQSFPNVQPFSNVQQQQPFSNVQQQQQQPFSNVQQQQQQQPFSNVQQQQQQPFSNMQQQQQPFSNVQQQPFSNTDVAFSGNQAAYSGFQSMYPAAGNFMGPGNNNPVPMMVPPPVNNFGQQNVNQGQRQPFYNPANQNNSNQTYFPNKY